jgi:hypothetical protein
MRHAALGTLVLALSTVAASAGDPPPAPAKEPEDLDARIDAALAAPPAERASHARALAADASAAIARLLERFAPRPPAVDLGVDRGRGVALGIRFVAATEQALREALGIDAGDVEAFHTLEPSQVERLLDRIEVAEDTEQISATEVTVFDRQKTTIEVLDRLSYVSDFEVEVGQDAVVANPLVATETEGLRIDVRPTLSADGSLVTLETDVTSLAVARPIAEETQTLAGTEVRVQRPEVHSARRTRTFTVPLEMPTLWSVPRPACADASAKPVWVFVRATPAAIETRFLEEGDVEVILPRTSVDPPPELPPPGGR